MIENLEEKLKAFQGLEEVKINMQAFIQLLKVWKEEEHQQIAYSPVPLHFIFAGEEGTGRTQAAELMGQIYQALGFLTEGNVVKAKAVELNQEEMIQKSMGNILLLSGLNEIEQDTADCLETVLNIYRENFVMILRGTQQEVQELLERFPILRIRFCKCLDFGERREQEIKSLNQEITMVSASAVIEETEHSEYLDVNDRTGMLLKAGARLDLTAYIQEELRIRLVYERLKLPMEMDAYVFLLRDNELTGCDEDMIFFGNPVSEDNGVSVEEGTEFPETAFILNRVHQGIQKIAICFSAYGDNPAFDFSQVEKPVLQIFRKNEQIAWMDLQNLKSERTLVAAEIYRYQNTWKFRAVSAGYRDGLEQLCQRFGIEVE